MYQNKVLRQNASMNKTYHYKTTLASLNTSHDIFHQALTSSFEITDYLLRSWIRGLDHGSDNLPARNRDHLCNEARIRDQQGHPLPSAYAIRRKLSNNSGYYRLCYMWLQIMEMYSILKTKWLAVHL